MQLKDYINQLHYYRGGLAHQLMQGGISGISKFFAEAVIDYEHMRYQQAIPKFYTLMDGQDAGNYFAEFYWLICQKKLTYSDEDFANLTGSFYNLYQKSNLIACIYEAGDCYGYSSAETAKEFYRLYAHEMGSEQFLAGANPSFKQRAIINELLAEMNSPHRIIFEYKPPEIVEQAINAYKFQIHRLHFCLPPGASAKILTMPKGFEGNRWKNLDFVHNGAVQDGDWLVVFENSHYHQDALFAQIPIERRVLCTQNGTVYSLAQLSEFGSVLSQQNKPRDYRGQWYFGLAAGAVSFFSRGSGLIQGDGLNVLQLAYEKAKDKLFSIYFDYDEDNPAHQALHEFVTYLKFSLGDGCVVFGKNYQNSQNIYTDAIKDYKFHLVIDSDGVIDDKIFNPMIGDCLLIYLGAAQIGKYFDARGFRLINVQNPELALAHIKNIISSDLSEQTKEGIAMNRNLALFEYNIFDEIWRVVNRIE